MFGGLYLSTRCSAEVVRMVGTSSAPKLSTVFFDKKVSDIRATTSSTAAASFTSTDCVFLDFRSVSHDDVASAVRSLPNKQCTSDPIPTWLFKECSAEFVPFLCHLFNISLSSGVVPATFKSAYICPLLKKPDLDSADVKNYRPISNLTVISKLLEKLVTRQLLGYLSVNKLLPDWQSAYRAFRSTETAITGLLSDIFTALDTVDIAALALLDLSAAFDTADHAILLQRLRTSFGLNGTSCVVLVLFISGSASAARVPPRQAVSNIRRPLRRAPCVRIGPAPIRFVYG